MVKKSEDILTVLVCCYNAEEFIKKCLDSLADQISAINFEILFVDDASTDNSLKIAESYSKKLKNFKIINNRENEGLVRCCNKAIQEIKTPYFMRLDADDWLVSDAIEKILKEVGSLKKEDFIVFKRVDVFGNTVKEINISDDIYLWISGGSVFNTNAIKSVGGYSNEYWEEYDLYIKLLEVGYRYKVSSHCIYYYRRGHQSMTQDYEKKKSGSASLLKKWGVETLKKYGNPENIKQYYESKEDLNV